MVICGLDHANMAEEQDVLARAGVRLVVVPARTEAEYLERCGEADALLIQYGAVTRRVLEGLPRVRVLVRYGVGVDGIDLAAATDQGVPVVNVPDYGTDEVANHAVALLLALARKLARLDRQTRSGGWDVFRVGPVTRLAGQTVGIVGCGRIGSAVARKLGGFDVRLLGCDPHIATFPPGVQPVAFERLLAESDYVTIHCPLTAETRHLFDAESLGWMRPTAVLINTARGGIVDTAALVAALQQGLLAGAGLDVLEQEPLDPASPLLRMEQVIVTPHAAWYSEEGRSDLKRRAAEEAVRVLRGERPRHCVNPEALGRLRRPPAAARLTARVAEPLFDVVAPGEVMLRLASRPPTRLEQARELDVSYGGTEANVLCALARLGHRTAWISALPANVWGERLARELRGHGVDVGHVAWREGGRIGTYFIEYGVAPRPIRVVYDRKDSAFASLDESEVDWAAVSRTRVVHVTGITAALGPRPRRVFERAVESARASGALLSLDVNHRTALWTPEAARAYLEPLLAARRAPVRRDRGRAARLRAHGRARGRRGRAAAARARGDRRPDPRRPGLGGPDRPAAPPDAPLQPGRRGGSGRRRRRVRGGIPAWLADDG